MRLIDLSHPFDPKLYPRKPNDKSAPLEIRTVKTAEEHGVSMREIAFGNHIGTHLDAPLHLVMGGESVDQLPLDTFWGPAVVLDIPKGPNGGVGPDDLEAAEPSIEHGDIVVICSGWSQKLTEPEYASHHPYLTDDGARWLVAQGVKMVGMDVQSVDLPHSLRPAGFAYTSLRTLLENRVPALLNLTNLEPVLGHRVTLFALPIGFTGADGAPARVVAEVD